MPAATDITLSTAVNTLWRKEQGGLHSAFNFEVEEFGWLEQLSQFNMNYSTREVFKPLDLTEEVGAADIPEGGYEARTGSVKPTDASFTFTIKNVRFTITRLAQAIQRKNAKAMIAGQMRHQGRKKMQALARVCGFQFYGHSTNVLFTTTTVATSTTDDYTLANAFGNTTLAISDKNYIAKMVKAGDYVALVRAGALVPNAIGIVNADVDTSGGSATVNVTWAGSVTSASGDQFVLANNIEDTTLADGTSYNRGWVGILDALFTTSVHGISSATVANWSPALLETNSGAAFTSIKLMKIKDEIGNYSNGSLKRLYMAQGVYRDFTNTQLGKVEFDDILDLEMEADLKSKRLGVMKSRKTPPGMVIGNDPSEHKRWNLFPKANESMWDDGDKIEGRSAMAFSMEFPSQTVHTSRKAWAAIYNNQEA